jgi:hypothetical protein
MFERWTIAAHGSSDERAASPILHRVIHPLDSLRRIARAVRLVIRDGGLPRWLRGLAAVGVAPIPGPFDEIVLLIVAAILWLGYRDRLRAAWLDSASA